MFFKVLLYQNIFIPAKFFGENLEKKIYSYLMKMTEGKRVTPFGFVIIIIAFFPIINPGKIIPGSSSALFRVSYDALTFRAIKGEIMEIIVTNITKFGFFGEAGVIEVFVSKKLMPDDYLYYPDKDTFYNANSDLNLHQGTKIMVRILGTRNRSNCESDSLNDYIQAIGTMKI